MKMFVAGQWVDKSQKIEVKNPYDGSVVDTVPKADATDVEKALAGAVEGAKLMRAMPAYQRYKILNRASQLMHERKQDLAKTLTLEEGKPIRESLAKPRGPPKPSNFRPRRPSASTPKSSRWMPPPTVQANSASRCAFPAASWRRSRRLTFR